MPQKDRHAGITQNATGTVFDKPLLFVAVATDPPDPPPGQSVLWMSDGTDTGDAGDIICRTNVAGTVKTTTVVDHSAGA
jgi:hypothetical protein